MENNSNVCRVCLDPEDAECHLPIFDDDNQIAERIFLISGVQVAEMNDSSAVICRQCMTHLSQAFCFREKCLKAEKHFRSFVSQNLSSYPKTELSSKVEILEYELVEKCNDGLEEELDKNDEVVFEIQLFTKAAARRSSRRNIDVKEVKKDKHKERFFCSKCFKSFCDQSYLKKHEYYRHSHIPVEDLFECDFCGHKTKTKQLVRNHITTVHSSTPREKFICRVCGKMLSTKGNLDGHEKTHVEMDLSEYVTCPVCSKHFREKRFMIEHRKLVHDKSKAFQCPHCPHVSTCKGAYNKHFKSVHLKLRDFICTDCGLGFSTNSQLTRHFRIHTGERPYECKNCTKPFRLSSHRKRHEEICPKKLNE